jgi:hypothetical protein
MKTQILYTAAALSLFAFGAHAADLSTVKAGVAAKASEVSAPVAAKVEDKAAPVAAAASAAPAAPAASSTVAKVKHHVKTKAKAAKDAAAQAVTQ